MRNSLLILGGGVGWNGLTPSIPIPDEVKILAHITLYMYRAESLLDNDSTLVDLVDFFGEEKKYYVLISHYFSHKHTSRVLDLSKTLAQRYL